MRTPCLLLVALCLLFSQVAPGDSLPRDLKPDLYECRRKGGACLYTSCPLLTRTMGTCDRGKAYCCKPK
uniref:Beta-defensin 1 n=1 Tax=Microcebus murinus TaxID=30608 RepID=A0A8C5YDR7_MICMU